MRNKPVPSHRKPVIIAKAKQRLRLLRASGVVTSPKECLDYALQELNIRVAK